MITEKKVLFDYSELKGRIKAKYNTQTAFGEAMGWSVGTTSHKLACRAYFSQDEIRKASKLLGISPQQIGYYFFTRRV